MLYIILWAIIWWWMMRTPLSAENAWISSLWIVFLWLIVCFYIGKNYWKKALLWVLWVGLFGIFIEFIGIKTCFPYGCFQYSDLVGWKFLWTFPYTLLFLWPVIVCGIIQFIPYRGKLLLSAFLWWITLAIFDLFLDPVAVAQWLWIYDIQQWYGVPWSNYLWWILTWTMSSWILLRWSSILLGDRFLKKLGCVLVGMYVMWFLVVVWLVPVF